MARAGLSAASPPGSCMGGRFHFWLDFPWRYSLWRCPCFLSQRRSTGLELPTAAMEKRDSEYTQLIFSAAQPASACDARLTEHNQAEDVSGVLLDASWRLTATVPMPRNGTFG